MQQIVDVLQSRPEPVDTNWSQRQKLHRARLKGGDVLELAAVVRDLGGRAAASGLSNSESQLYAALSPSPASELRYVLGVDAERAAAYIDAQGRSARGFEASIGGASAAAPRVD